MTTLNEYAQLIADNQAKELAIVLKNEVNQTVVLGVWQASCLVSDNALAVKIHRFWPSGLNPVTKILVNPDKSESIIDVPVLREVLDKTTAILVEKVNNLRGSNVQ
tara:strand:+ start:515 stop:832 length:318 start_codon:yes stop_codon:yes gene_type:complete